MVDLDLIAAKLGDLADRVARVRAVRPGSADELAADRDALDLVSFNLMLAVQTCVDVASHLISDEGWAPAADFATSFRRLHEHGVVDTDLADVLGRAADLRKVIGRLDAHHDADLLFTAATGGLYDLERFARQVGRWARKQHVRRQGKDLLRLVEYTSLAEETLNAIEEQVDRRQEDIARAPKL